MKTFILALLLAAGAAHGATPTSTISPTSTATPTITQTWSITKTRTITPSSTITATFANSRTSTKSPTNTPTPSITPSRTATRSSTRTITATKTISQTITPTHTPTVSPSITMTRTITVTFSSTFTPTNTPSVTPTFTVTPSVTPTITRTNIVTMVPTPEYDLLWKHVEIGDGPGTSASDPLFVAGGTGGVTETPVPTATPIAPLLTLVALQTTVAQSSLQLTQIANQGSQITSAQQATTTAQSISASAASMAALMGTGGAGAAINVSQVGGTNLSYASTGTGGKLPVALFSSNGNSVNIQSSVPADTLSNAVTALWTNSYGSVFNGTDWARARAATGTALAVGVPAAGMFGWNGTTNLPISSINMAGAGTGFAANNVTGLPVVAVMAAGSDTGAAGAQALAYHSDSTNVAAGARSLLVQNLNMGFNGTSWTAVTVSSPGSALTTAGTGAQATNSLTYAIGAGNPVTIWGESLSDNAGSGFPRNALFVESFPALVTGTNGGGVLQTSLQRIPSGNSTGLRPSVAVSTAAATNIWYPAGASNKLRLMRLKYWIPNGVTSATQNNVLTIFDGATTVTTIPMNIPAAALATVPGGFTDEINFGNGWVGSAANVTLTATLTADLTSACPACIRIQTFGTEGAAP